MTMAPSLRHLRQESQRATIVEVVAPGARTGSDEELAELIRSDGRRRLEAGEYLELREYLTAMPDLPNRPLALDAAIDVTLRSLSGASRPTPEAVETLADNYPGLAAAIREAAALSEALWSTNGIPQPGAPSSRLAIGNEFGPAMARGGQRYELVRRLGTGAHGEVFLARDRQLSDASQAAMVAIKVLHGGGLDASLFGSLLDEAIKARRLSHDNVVRVIDAGVLESGEEYVVYEHAPGLPLDEWVERRGRVSPRDAAKLIRSVAQGLHAAHAARLVHRDLKPSNIIVDEEGCPRITDFGVAHRIDEPDSPAAGDASRLGNLAFMAPERHGNDEGAALPAADLYALAGLLYWLLSGALPNGSTRSEVEASLARGGRTREEIRLELRARKIDRDLASICARSLSADPSERHDSAAQFAEDLEAWLDRRPIRWTQPSPLRVGGLWAIRRPGLAAALGFTILLAGGSIVGLGAAVRFGALAHEQTLQREIAEVRLEEEQKWRVESARSVFELVAKLRPLIKTGAAAENLTTVWMYEWAFGRTMFKSPDHLYELWDVRIDILRHAYTESIARSPEGQSVQSLLLGMPLGLWLIRAGEAEEALPLLEQTRAGWASRTYPQDPWLERIDALIACAEADLTLADPSVAASALRAHVERLSAYADALDAMVDSAQLHFLVLDRIRALARSERVADAALAEEMTARIAVLDVSGTK